ncbi:MAG: CHAT domain-containing protein, partial [Cyclobacteriaceae bacterium]
VVAGLWKVYDEDARTFFQLFYTKLQQGIPKVFALREAMVEMMEDKDKEHFYHWAAFVLHGYWR